MRRVSATVALLMLLVVSTRATEFTAASAGYFDVTNAALTAVAGDTIRVPAGTAIWSNHWKLTFPLNVIGAGTNQTILSNQIPRVSPWNTGTLRPPFFWLKYTNANLARISGFTFECQTNGVVVSTPYNMTGDPINWLRFDHNTVHDAYSRVLELEGSIYGVIDHCLFTNCCIITEPIADHDVEWARFTPPMYFLGGSNTIVVESCLVAYEAGIYSDPAPMACGQGGHYVFRFNTVTNHSALVQQEGLDVHGNNYYYGDDPAFPSPQPGWRGSIGTEIYGNNFFMATSSFRSMKLRGGTCMVFSNAFWGTATATGICLDEEESWASTFDPHRTVYPAQDQITNSFFWANSRNGGASPPVYRFDPDIQPNPVLTFVQQDRDYWLQSPWTLSYTNGGGGINVMTNYQPMVYPHPIVTAQDGPSPPRRVQVNTVRVGTLKGKR